MNTVNVRFKELRMKLGLTQAEMAARLGMAQPAWGRFEIGGVPDPRCSTIVLICKTFNVSADWLLGLKEE